MTLSPALFPPAGYMAIWLYHPEVLIEAHEHYQKQSYRSRYHIAGPNGFQVLKVPVSKEHGQHCMTSQIPVVYHDSWPLFHFRSLDTAYNNAPYYLYYRDEVGRLLHHPFDNLWELCKASLELTGAMCGIKREVIPTGSFISANNKAEDYRAAIHPKRPLPWENEVTLPVYHQVFSDRYPFIPSLSILDLLFNEGPGAQTWLLDYYRLIAPTLPV
jgi:hypothetical protein